MEEHAPGPLTSDHYRRSMSSPNDPVLVSPKYFVQFEADTFCSRKQGPVAGTPRVPTAATAAREQLSGR